MVLKWFGAGVLDDHQGSSQQAPKRQFFLYFLTIFSIFSSRKFKFSILLRRGPGLGLGTGPGPGPGPAKKDGKCFLFFSTVFSSRMGQKNAKKHRFFYYFFILFFPNIWPLAGPNIAKRMGSLLKLARVDRQTHFGTFDFWIKPEFWWFWRVLRMFLRIFSI